MKRRSRGILTLAVSLTLALLVAGCSTTQTAGRQIDDTTIHTEVMAKLTSARFSNIVNIDINVTKGIVTLGG
jgi:osmotically-inducible protein OsmY